jgi:lysozyme family protein
MKAPKLDKLREDYTNDWIEVAILDELADEIDDIVNRAVKNKFRYDSIPSAQRIPWPLIAAIHNLECSQRFDQHLHNGDSLDRKTIHVPEGRPPGRGPWRWEDSAHDALSIAGFLGWSDWSVAGCLYKAEAYNGWGYRAKDIRSPYLWGGSSKQQPGKYVRDGVWSATAVTKQIGVATLLCRMFERDIYVFPEDKEQLNGE